jgi:hypothetical protein
VLIEALGAVRASSREQALEFVLDGTGPDLPIEVDGEGGRVRFVPLSAWGDSVPVRARRKVVLEVADDAS